MFCYFLRRIWTKIWKAGLLEYKLIQNFIYENWYLLKFLPSRLLTWVSTKWASWFLKPGDFLWQSYLYQFGLCRNLGFKIETFNFYFRLSSVKVILNAMNSPSKSSHWYRFLWMNWIDKILHQLKQQDQLFLIK